MVRAVSGLGILAALAAAFAVLLGGVVSETSRQGRPGVPWERPAPGDFAGEEQEEGPW